MNWRHSLNPGRGYVADVALGFAGMWLGVTLAYGVSGQSGAPAVAPVLGGLFAALVAVALLVVGASRSVWRWTSADDLIRVGAAVVLSALGLLAALFLVSELSDVPRLAPVFGAMVSAGLMAGARSLVRAVSGGGWRALFRRVQADAPATILVGPTDAVTRAIHAARGPNHDRPLSFRPVAIISTQGNQAGKVFAGARVHSGLDELEPQVLAARRRHAEVRIALVGDDPRRTVAQTALGIAGRHGIPLMRIPETPGEALAPVQPADVLGRIRKDLDPAGPQALIAGKRVLVTGAGGTIGGEICRQIAALGPASLHLVELSEHNLYEIDRAIAEIAPDLPRTASLMDVRDARRVAALFGQTRPDIVVHAAANKHVPLMEANVCQAILVNLGGTRVVADAALAAGVQAFIFISTDKAVAPANVMGAAKRAGELYVRHCARRAGGRFHAVRFGNVLGSSGSVMPLFERQIAAGGPITLTHRDMTRWFMTVEEASSLVLQAAALGAATPLPEGGLFVLDMGEPVRILDLAHAMVRMKGKEPGRDIEIRETGLRPGEKLHESLFITGEIVGTTTVPGISLATSSEPLAPALPSLVEATLAAADSDDAPAALAALSALVPSFRPAAGVRPAHGASPPARRRRGQR